MSLLCNRNSDYDSGSSSEPDDESGFELESSVGPNVPSESPPDLPSRGDLSVAQGAQVNQEQDSRTPGAVLPLKGDQNKHEPTSNDSAKKEELSIYFKWYSYDSSSIFREILTEFGIKNNVDRFVNILYAAAELNVF